MSRADVDTIRALYERWGRGDFNTADAFDPEVEFARHGGEVVVTRQARGIEALWAAVVELIREWRDLRYEAERFVEAGDRVLALVRMRAVGKRSGVAMEHREASLFKLRDGKIVRWDTYWDPDEAMRELGLEP